MPTPHEDMMDAAECLGMAKELQEFTLQQFGKRCSAYSEACATCRAWRIVDNFRELNCLDPLEDSNVPSDT